MRTQPENGQKKNCLPCPNSDDQPLPLWKNVLMGIKFSREFSTKCQVKPCFGRSKPSNSLENLAVSCLQSSSKRIIREEFERLKHNKPYRGGAQTGIHLPFGGCVRTLLSPSCHPCHPQKRVQTPCTSAFCHPDTLFSKISM